MPKTVKWGHYERKITIDFEIPFHLMLEDANGAAYGQFYLDNVILSSTHGPEIVRNTPYLHS